MKKIFLNLLVFILMSFTINNSYSFKVNQLSKEEIDKIQCDLKFQWELYEWYNYTFNDTFINSSWREVKVIESEVNIYEEEDFNQSDFFSEAKFSSWSLEKDNIYQPWDRWIITELNDNYKINITPKVSKQDNFIIKYTLSVYYKWSDWKFSNGPHPHTECKEYKIVWDVDEDDAIEKDIHSTYNKYIKIKEKLKEIIFDENKKWKKIIKLPKVLPKTWTPILDKVKKLTNLEIDTEIKKNRFILAGSTNEDINFWKKILNIKDKNADKYIVIPSNGLVIPINDIPVNTTDYKKIVSWREIELNTYLKTGVMEYPWTSIRWFWKVWNKVIFGHSSYWKKDNWRYKTDFWKIIELDPTEEIWIYEKNNGVYNLFKYKVELSYETTDNDITVLNPWIWKNLSLITCTPIWGISGRWIIKAKYIDKEKSELIKKISFNSLDRKLKIKITNLVKKIWNDKNKVLNIFNLIIKKEKQIWKLNETKKIKKIKIVLEYLKFKLAMEYYK